MTAADVPLGGNAGLSHQHSAAIDQAVAWLATPAASQQRPVVPALRRLFGLTVGEAIEAIKAHNLRSARAQ